YTKGVQMNILNTRDGSIIMSYPLGSSSAAAGLMAATTPSGGIAYASNKIDFADKISDRFYQADTNGRIWELDTGGFSASSGALEPSYWPASIASPLSIAPQTTGQPLYHGPAAGYYESHPSYASSTTQSISVMAWAGGSFFENSTTLNDPACTTGCFTPNLYFRTQDLGATPAFSPSTSSLSVPALSYIVDPTIVTVCPGSANCRYYSNRARIIGPPSLYIPIVLNSQG